MQRYITWDYGVLGSTKVRLLKRRIKRGH
jgi:hypothetical protein